MRRLHHTPLSPFCRKVRMVLKEKDLPYELVEEMPWRGTPSLMALNPAGEVPVLVEDGASICGSAPICEYLEEAHPTPGVLGTTPLARAEVRRLVDWFDRLFDVEVTQNILFEKVFRRLVDGGPPDSARLRYGKQRLYAHLDMIGALRGERYYLTGDHPTLADLAAAAHLSALDYLGDVPWDYNENAAQWYGLMKSRPSVRAVLADRVSGIHPPAHYENADF